MGIIDPWSDHSLYDVLDGSLGFEDHQPADAIDFYGFHITPASPDGGSYIVSYDGHVGTVMEFESDDYDDVLELVDDLMDKVFEAHHYDYQDDTEALVEWAGRIQTSDKQRAEENPDTHIYVPENPIENSDEIGSTQTD